MPRKPRLEVAGGIHHIFNRGNNGRTLFDADHDCRIFLADVQRTAETRGWICLSYCLLVNHFHLLVETPQPNLSVGMHGLETRLAQAVNERGGYGRVFQDRFGSKLVDTPAYLAHMFRYIALNPVHANLCRSPADWKWSGHRALASGSGAALARVERVLELLAEWGGVADQRYVRLFDESGPHGPWSNAATPDPPRPSVTELVAIEGSVDAAMRSARWDFGYRLADIAEALNLSVPTVSRRTHR